MTPEQTDEIRSISERVMYIQGRRNDPKTLLYGYDTDRYTWHTYQDEQGHLSRVVYNHNGDLLNRIHGFQLCVDFLVPNKRLYPEACDFEFCKELKSLGIGLPFTTFGTIHR